MPPSSIENQEPLKLLAFDNEDLEIISTHCQDAVVRISDIGFVPSERRFALILNRFDWENSIDTGAKNHNQHRRRRSALRFEYVKSVKKLNMDLTKKDSVKDLLAICYQQNPAPVGSNQQNTDKQSTNPESTDLDSKGPEGTISLIFAGQSEIKLEIECIEAILQDLGAIWETKSMPEHNGN